MLFGVEDALVSTTGVVVGISAGTQNRSFVILAAIVTVMVEAFSMGAGEYLTESSVRELERSKKSKSSPRIGGLLMFISYFCAGLLPVIPIIIFSYPTSAIGSTVASICGLFALGYVKGKVIRSHPLRSGFKVLFVGGTATLAGLIVGLVLRWYGV